MAERRTRQWRVQIWFMALRMELSFQIYCKLTSVSAYKCQRRVVLSFKIKSTHWSYSRRGELSIAEKTKKQTPKIHPAFSLMRASGGKARRTQNPLLPKVLSPHIVPQTKGQLLMYL